jgi:hypothetical protein
MQAHLEEYKSYFERTGETPVVTRPTPAQEAALRELNDLIRSGQVCHSGDSMCRIGVEQAARERQATQQSCKVFSLDPGKTARCTEEARTRGSRREGFDPSPDEVEAELRRRGLEPAHPELVRTRYVPGGLLQTEAAITDEHGIRTRVWGVEYERVRAELRQHNENAANPRYQSLKDAIDALLAEGESPTAHSIDRLTLALIAAPEEAEQFDLREVEARVGWARQDAVIGEDQLHLFETFRQPKSDEELAWSLQQQFDGVIDLCSPLPLDPEQLHFGLLTWTGLERAGRAAAVRPAWEARLRRSSDRHYRFASIDEIIARARALERPPPRYRCMNAEAQGGRVPTGAPPE